MAPHTFHTAALLLLLLLLAASHALPPPPTTARLDLCPHPAPPIPPPPPAPPTNPHLLDLTTADDLINNHCAPIILLFARGTGNPGNLGPSLGTPLLAAMRAGLPHAVIAQGVLPYPAKTLGYLQGGSREGVDAMVALAYKARCQCPRSALVLAGFSQGAQVLRRAVGYLPAQMAQSVLAVLSFSDSRFPSPLPGPWARRHISLCQRRDWICDRAYTAISGRHYSALYIPFLGVVVEQLAERLRVMEEGEGEGEGKVDFCAFRGVREAGLRF